MPRAHSCWPKNSAPLNFTNWLSTWPWIALPNGLRISPLHAFAASVAFVGSADVAVAVVHFEVSDLHRRVIHDLVEDLIIDRRGVHQDVAVLHPCLVVMAGGEIAGHRDANALGELHVEVGIRDGVVEPV